MTNQELDKLLRAAREPEPPANYWELFPRRVMEQARGRAGEATRDRLKITNRSGSFQDDLKALARQPALIFGTALAIGALAFILWKQPYPDSGHKELAEAAKYFRELEALFPNQLQAIVLDAAGAHIVLADQANLAAGAPLYLKLCNGQGCWRFVTFSGQRIRFSGQEFEVLSSRQGEVLLIGEHIVWSSAGPAKVGTAMRIEARALETAS